MKKVIVKVIASAEVELDDDYDVYDIDQYVKDEYYNLAYPESEFKLVGYEVEEREEEEKFYLQKMKSFYDEDYDKERAYLNRNARLHSYFLSNTDGLGIFQNQFTQKEIDKIKEEQHTDLSEFKQIPIEEIEA